MEVDGAVLRPDDARAAAWRLPTVRPLGTHRHRWVARITREVNMHPDGLGPWMLHDMPLAELVALPPVRRLLYEAARSVA
jgi:hypothetical protein